MLSHLADLRADFMRFFPQLGLDPFASLDGPTLFDLAERVSAYGGVMTARVRDLVDNDTTSGAAPTARQPTHLHNMRVPDGAKVVDLDGFAAENFDLFDRRTVSLAG